MKLSVTIQCVSIAIVSVVLYLQQTENESPSDYVAPACSVTTSGDLAIDLLTNRCSAQLHLT